MPQAIGHFCLHGGPSNGRGSVGRDSPDQGRASTYSASRMILRAAAVTFSRWLLGCRRLLTMISAAPIGGNLMFMQVIAVEACRGSLGTSWHPYSRSAVRLSAHSGSADYWRSAAQSARLVRLRRIGYGQYRPPRLSLRLLADRAVADGAGGTVRAVHLRGRVPLGGLSGYSIVAAAGFSPARRGRRSSRRNGEATSMMISIR